MSESIAATFPPKVNRASLASLLRRYRLPLSGIGRAAGQPYRFDPFLGLSFFIGSLTSQGFITHGANTAAQTYGAKGAGIKVGILSDSAESLSMLIGTGDLPPGTLNVADIDQILNGGPGTSEGTAMMEIVYDLAPGVQLFFASAFNGEDSFADNIRLLRNTYHCDIIADDVSYSDEPVFPGRRNRAGGERRHPGRRAVFLLGRQRGQSHQRNLGHLGRRLQPGGRGRQPPARPATRSTRSAPTTLCASASATPDVTVHWSDPLGNSTNDYDLFILNAAGTAVLPEAVPRRSRKAPDSDPIEEVFNPNGFPANSRIVVVAKAGAQPRALHIGTFGGALQVFTSGETHGHNAPGRLCSDRPELPGTRLRRSRRRLEQRARRHPRLRRRSIQPYRDLQLRWTAPHVLQSGWDPDHRRQLPVRDQWRCRAGEAGHHRRGWRDRPDAGLQPVLRHFGGGASCRGRGGDREVRQALRHRSPDLQRAHHDGSRHPRRRNRPRFRLRNRHGARRRQRHSSLIREVVGQVGNLRRVDDPPTRCKHASCPTIHFGSHSPGC